VDGAAAKAFKDVAAVMDDQKFAITSAEALFTEYKVDAGETVVLFKKFDEGRNDLTEELTSTEAITKFIAANALPLVVEFNHETGNFILIRVNADLHDGTHTGVMQI
jgi:protein disulfide-isomerase A1